MRLLVHPLKPEALIIDRREVRRWSLGSIPALLSQGALDEGDHPALAGGPGVFGIGWSNASSALRQPARFEIRDWDTLAIRARESLPESGVYLSALAFSPDGKWIAAADAYEQITLLDAATLRPVDRAEGGEATSGLAFDPSSRFLAALCTSQGGGFMRVHAIDQGKLRIVHPELQHDLEGDLADTFGTCGFGPAWDTVVFYMGSADPSPTLIAFDVDGGGQLWKRHFEVPESSRYDFFSDLAFLGSNVFAIRPDGLVFSLDLRSGEEELVATVVPGTRHLAADSVGRLWTLSEGKPVPLASM